MVREFIRLELAALLLRVGLGLIALGHGLVVIRNGWGAGWESVLPRDFHTAAAWAEVVAGGLLIIGLLTRPAALVLAVVAGAATWITFRQRPFFSTEPPTAASVGDVLTVAAEYSVALLLISLAVVVMGGGLISVDRLFGKLIRRKTREVASSVVSLPSDPAPPRR